MRGRADSGVTPGPAATGSGSQPTRGAVVADALLDPWFSCLKERIPGVRVFDCHTHLGSDPDGSRQTADELQDALDVVGARAVVFPLSEPGAHRVANDQMIAAAEASGGQLVAFCRVDPRADGLAEAQRP